MTFQTHTLYNIEYSRRQNLNFQLIILEITFFLQKFDFINEKC